MKKKHIYLVCICIVTFIVTLLTAYMGYSIYNNNNRDITNKIIQVEMADASDTIAYDIELGKDIENFYGLPSILYKAASLFDNIECMYVTDDFGNIIASSSDEKELHLPVDIRYHKDGFVTGGGYFYSVDGINEELNLVSKSPESMMNDDVADYINMLIYFSAIGGFLVLIALTVTVISIKEFDKSKKVATYIIMAWILALGIYVCRASYVDYNESISEIENTIDGIYNYELNSIESKGIDRQYIGSIEDYTSRYIDEVEEISEIVENDYRLEFVVSRTYMNRVILGYLVQVLMIFFFSIIMLGELNIFINDTLIVGGSVGQKSD